MPALHFQSSLIPPGSVCSLVSARNVPREFRVFYTVMYSLKTENDTLLDSRSHTLTRDYTWSETQVLGKEKEEQLMREAIVGDLVRTVLIQLSDPVAGRRRALS